MNRKNILCVILFSIMTFVSCSDNGNSNSSSNSEARYSISGTIQNARKQKLVLQAADQLRANCSTNTSVDIVASLLEIT